MSDLVVLGASASFNRNLTLLKAILLNAWDYFNDDNDECISKATNSFSSEHAGNS